MKKVVIMVGLLLVASSGWAKGIEFFHGSWDELLQKAKVEKKKIFVDVYTQWCGPCKMMAAEVFPQDQVGEFYNTNFINFKLDAEDEDMNGPDLAEKYDVNLYPTYLFLNAEGDIQYRSSSRMSAPVFLAVAKEALGEFGEGFQQMGEKYKAGSREPVFVRNYLMKAKVAMGSMSRHQRNKTAAQMKLAHEEYFASRMQNTQINAEDFELIKAYSHSRGEDQVEYVVEHYKAFANVVSEKELAAFLVKVNDHSIGYLSRNSDERYRTYLKDIRGVLNSAYSAMGDAGRKGLSAYEDMRMTAEFNFAVSDKRWDEMLAIAKENVEARGDQADWEVWYNVPRNLFYRCKDKDVLKSVTEYARRAYELDKNFKVAVLYGKLLAKIDENQKAKVVIGEALSLIDETAVKGKEKYRTELKRLIENL